jgi:hypothetical protein
MAHGITFHANFTYAKAFDDTASNMISNQSQSTLQTAYNWRIEKARTQLPPRALNVMLTYQLPFGKGRPFANNSGWVSQVVGGWQLSGIGTYRSGMPIGTIMTSACVLPQAASCFANYNPSFTGPVRINGAWGSGNLLGSSPPTFLDKNAFAAPAPYTYGNTPRTNAFGITNPPTYDIDLNVRREFGILEKVRFIFQADAFNVFNFVNFSPSSTNMNSSAFGTITSQANSPRILQLSARVRF